MQLHSEQNYIQHLSIECVILGYKEKQLNVLLPKLNFQGDFYALPTGFVYQGEDVDAAAQRILWERTQLAGIDLESFAVFGQADRNSLAFMDRLLASNPAVQVQEQKNRRELEWFTQRFVSIGYYALVDMDKVIPKKNEIDHSIAWYPVWNLPTLIMDHNQIVERAIDNLRTTFDQKLSAFKLLPDVFTMKEVKEVYETIFGKPFAMNNFQKKILDLRVMERLGKKFTGVANKAPYIYRFINR